ncbi:abortive infection family protein [Burkholderia sp. LMU1-1-1.1]|uniref:abortive infection family protein n=1 Tax=Burkholderia sp. LMU1-1-1.1 TaxID=3135266 RepID=UPI00342B9DF9
MRKLIPAPAVAAVAEILSQRTTHASLDNLFMHAGAPGEPPEGSKWVKAQEWLRRVNRDETVQPLSVLGRLIETYMEEDPPEPSPFDEGPPRTETDDQEKIRKALARYDLQYVRGGLISGTLGTPSKALEDYIRDRDLPAMDHEFSRALANVEHSPREAVSAASNILESVCKVYIAERGLEAPPKQDLKPVWSVVRKDLGFDPSVVEDKDLQVILTGLFAIVEGIGALRTHTSSAHGAGKKQYKLQPRHARLAIHSAHTAALFILESWDKKVS